MSDKPAASLDELMSRLRGRQEQADAVYAALRSNTRTRKRARTLTYRCPNSHRCALAEVYASPVGVLIHHPRYKLSPVLNEASSSEAGRLANTVDGDRRWQGRTYFLEMAVNLTLNCDHVHHAVIDREQVLQDISAGRSEVVVES